MKEQKHQPVSCDYHDQLEGAAVRRREVEFEFEDKGVRQRARGIIGDVHSSSGEEFVKLQRGDSSIDVRLDRVLGLRELG